MKYLPLTPLLEETQEDSILLDPDPLEIVPMSSRGVPGTAKTGQSDSGEEGESGCESGIS